MAGVQAERLPLRGVPTVAVVWRAIALATVLALGACSSSAPRSATASAPATTTTTSTTSTTSTTAVSPTSASPSSTAAASDTEPAVNDGIVRAAFYYPWFPEAWQQQGFDPFTMYHPDLGFYSSRDTSTVARHIAAMQYAHLDAGIISWWGQGTRTDDAVPVDLAAAAGTTWKWALYYEQEGSGDPTTQQIRDDLTYIAQRYAADSSYLRIADRPVLFVYGDGNDRCSVADRWTNANAGIGFYIVLKVFPGYASCTAQPDSWHQYAPAEESKDVPGYSETISPGFNKPGDPGPRLERDPERWRQTAEAMVATNEPVQLVTTFNEWGEGTAVEGATEWASDSGFGTYLDALHDVLPP